MSIFKMGIVEQRTLARWLASYIEINHTKYRQNRRRTESPEKNRESPLFTLSSLCELMDSASKIDPCLLRFVCLALTPSSFFL